MEATSYRKIKIGNYAICWGKEDSEAFVVALLQTRIQGSRQTRQVHIFRWSKPENGKIRIAHTKRRQVLEKIIGHGQ